MVDVGRKSTAWHSILMVVLAIPMFAIVVGKIIASKEIREWVVEKVAAFRAFLVEMIAARPVYVGEKIMALRVFFQARFERA